MRAAELSFIFNMRINVKAKPEAREEKVEKVDDQNFVVSVKEPPVNGLATKAICHALAEFFGVHMTRVCIVSGYTSRNKIVEIK